MPDDHHPLKPRREPERIDLGAIKIDPNSDRTVSRLPTRQELALRSLYVIAGSASLVIAWIELSGASAFRLSAHPRPPQRDFIGGSYRICSTK